LLKEDNFLLKLAASAPGASAVTELAKDDFEDHYVPQAVVLPSCLVPDLLLLPRDPLAAWRLLRARASELGVVAHCTSLWLLLRALSSVNHREDSCVSLELVDGNSHFVNARRQLLETILPALAPNASPPVPAPVPPQAINAGGTATLAAALEAATRPAAQKVISVEEKWPHSFRRLLLLTGVGAVDELQGFWHDYADQKKAQRWAYVQSAMSAMAESLGL
jgi:hypothetical protein